MLIQIREGCIKKGDSIMSCNSGKKYDIFEVGLLHPECVPLKQLSAGQVGYVFTNMKDATEANIGDTFYKENFKVQALPGFKLPKPMVFAGVYPDDPAEFIKLKNSLQKLILTDPSVTVQP